MYRDQTICVVVPAYNEELLIGRVVETMPEFVDVIVVVNDASSDTTQKEVLEHKRREDAHGRIIILDHERNEGVGAAIVTGYRWALENNIDLTAVMAGDGQMDPADLTGLLDAAIDQDLDYVKGNRLFTGEAWKIIPRHRYLGNSVLSLLTKIASGYWHVADSQTGYTVIKRRALSLLPFDRIYPRYGVPNDLLVRLNVFDLRVADVPVSPVYDIGEKSGIRLSRVVFSIPLLLIRLFFYRMKEKYIIRDFHPLVFFYFLGAVLTTIGGLFGVVLVVLRLNGQGVAATSALFAALFFLSGLQLLLFGMWLDMERNKDLR